MTCSHVVLLLKFYMLLQYLLKFLKDKSVNNNISKLTHYKITNVKRMVVLIISIYQVSELKKALKYKFRKRNRIISILLLHCIEVKKAWLYIQILMIATKFSQLQSHWMTLKWLWLKRPLELRHPKIININIMIWSRAKSSMRVNPKLMNFLKELRMQQTRLSKVIYLILKACPINRFLNN